MTTKAEALAILLTNAGGLLLSAAVTGICAWAAFTVHRRKWPSLERNERMRSVVLTLLIFVFGIGVFVLIPHLILTIGWFTIWRS